MDQFRVKDVETLTSPEAVVSVASGLRIDMDGIDETPSVMLEVRNRTTGQFENVSLGRPDTLALIRALVHAVTVELP